MPPKSSCRCANTQCQGDSATLAVIGSESPGVWLVLLLNVLPQCADILIVLLHCYPNEREAGYLAQAFNNVSSTIWVRAPAPGQRSLPD